jgi:hypothetical protein
MSWDEIKTLQVQVLLLTTYFSNFTNIILLLFFHISASALGRGRGATSGRLATLLGFNA